MSTVLYYNQYGAPSFQPGNLTRSDYRAINCSFPYPPNSYAQQILLPALFPASSTTVFQISIAATGEVYSGNVVTTAVVDPTSVLFQINQILPGRYMASVNTAGNYVIDSPEIGSFGNFTITVGGVLQTNTPVAAAGVLKAGRLVVLVTNTIDIGNARRPINNAYRYPALGDNADLMSFAVLTIRDAHINQVRQYLPVDIGLVTAGTTFAGLYQGEMVLSPITAVSGTTPLFVETAVAGDLVGRITATATATTLPLPNGKLRCMSGTSLPNQTGRFRITEL